MAQYDYLVVGAGLFGSVFAREATRRGKRCLVIDRRPHIGGNVYTREDGGIQVHCYGAHIFHTRNRAVWDYVNQLAEFAPYTHEVVAVYQGKQYPLPFNMNTFVAMWGELTPEEAQARIAAQIAGTGAGEPANVEEQAIRMVGPEIYQKLVKGYTEKQWGRPCRELPAFIIRRLPLRFSFNNNYFDDPYQGMPRGGYTPMIRRLLEGAQVRCGVDYFSLGATEDLAKKTVFTGMIDEFFGYCYGPLQYRSLEFETRRLEAEDFQGRPVVNYTQGEIPYTRVIEHKHFEPAGQRGTVVSWEYPAEWAPGKEPYYPVNDPGNNRLYQRYAALAKTRPDVIFGGRLGAYRYYDMDGVIASALEAAHQALE